MKTIKQAVSECYDESARLLGIYIANAIHAQTGIKLKHLWCGYTEMHTAVYEDDEGSNVSTPLQIKIKVNASQDTSAKVLSLAQLFTGQLCIEFTEEAAELYANVSNGAAVYHFLNKREPMLIRNMNCKGRVSDVNY